MTHHHHQQTNGFQSPRETCRREGKPGRWLSKRAFLPGVPESRCGARTGVQSRGGRDPRRSSPRRPPALPARPRVPARGRVPGRPAPTRPQGLPPPQSRALVGGDRPEVRETLSEPCLRVRRARPPEPGGGCGGFGRRRGAAICEVGQRRGRRDSGHGPAVRDPGVGHGVDG